MLCTSSNAWANQSYTHMQFIVFWVISKFCTNMKLWARQMVHLHARFTPVTQSNWATNGWPNAMAKK